MKQRAIQIRLVKPKEQENIAPSFEEDDFTDKITQVTFAAKDVLREGAKVMGLLIVLDTARRVIVERAKK